MRTKTISFLLWVLPLALHLSASTMTLSGACGASGFPSVSCSGVDSYGNGGHGSAQYTIDGQQLSLLGSVTAYRSMDPHQSFGGESFDGFFSLPVAWANINLKLFSYLISNDNGWYGCGSCTIPLSVYENGVLLARSNGPNADTATWQSIAHQPGTGINLEFKTDTSWIQAMGAFTTVDFGFIAVDPVPASSGVPEPRNVALAALGLGLVLAISVVPPTWSVQKRKEWIKI